MLQDVSVVVPGGKMCAVRGKSGCGKSTLLLSAAGMMRPDEGTVRVVDFNIYDFTPDRSRFRSENIGFVFQQFHLLPYLNLLDNVLFAALGRPKNLQRNLRQRANELILRFELEHRLNHHPSELSTGERQRVALARALLNRPKVVLADEPTGNLDEENTEVVLNYLRQVADDGGAVLLATHDQQAASRADECWHMVDGRIGCSDDEVKSAGAEAT